MRQKPVNASTPYISLIFVVLLFLSLVPLSSLSLRRAEASPPTAISLTDGTGSPASLGTIITSGTSHVPLPLCTADCVITGGTRAGNNLFHSFGDFNIGASDSARFQTGLVNPLPDASVSNILARVTGGSSSLYGSLDSATYYPFANLFLMNPAGFLFGPNATVNVGGMMTFTTADYMRLRGPDGSNAGIFHADTAQTSILTSAPVAAFGFIGSNPGLITFEGGQLTVANGTGVTLVGGDINLVPDLSGIPSGITAPGGQIRLASIAGAGEGEIAADTGVPAPGMALGTITLGQGTVLSTAGDTSIGDGSGGAVSIRGGQFVATDTQILTSPAFGSTGQGGLVMIAATGDASLTNSTVDSSSFLASGNGGAVTMAASNLTLQDSAVVTNMLGDGTAAGGGGAVTLTGTTSVALTRSSISTDISASNGDGGAVAITAPIVSLENSRILTQALADGITPTTGGGGAVTLVGTTSLFLTGSTIDTSVFESQANAGVVTLAAPTVGMQGGSIDTSMHNTTEDPNAGNAGDIEITGTNVTLTDFARLASFADSIGTSSRGGTIRITGSDTVVLNNGTTFLTTTVSQAPAGSIELLGQHVTITQSKLFSNTLASGASGTIKITGKGDIALNAGSMISTATALGSDGSGGPIEINTPHLTITGGSQFKSETFGSGPGGNVTIHGTSGPAQLVLISDTGSGIFTDTLSTSIDGNVLGTGASGNIFVNANSVMLQNGGTLSAKTTGAGNAGDILVKADSMSITGGAQLTSSSSVRQAPFFPGEMIPSPTGNAGSINLTAMNGFTMQNSTITTQAGQGAGGGNIKVTTSPSATVLLVEHSLISASVADGSGGGGNISIDPQYVILQNSQILAQAAQGQGGAITIIANLFLPDANSLVNADSGSGVNGTVTIQSPNAPISGHIQPLGKTPLIATSLLNQRCASLAGGEFSSFTVAGRDSLPTEPGSWLASPLATLNAGMGIGMKAEGVKAEGMSASAGQVVSGQWRVGDTTILSLRQIAPAGFLTQAFAVEEPTGCQS